jgi:single-stranded-DNA-specific exonuclease
VTVARADIVGEKHVRCFLSDQQGGRLGAIAFRSVGTRLGDTLLARGGAAIHLAGTLRVDRWRGEARIQFSIEDAASVQSA